MKCNKCGNEKKYIGSVLGWFCIHCEDIKETAEETELNNTFLAMNEEF